MDVAIYSPDDVKLNVLGFDVEGFSGQSFIKITRDKQIVNERKSLKGNVLLTKMTTPTRTIEFQVDRTAKSNTWLHALMSLQELVSYRIPIPILIRDKNGQTRLFCAKSYFSSEPDVDFSTEVTQTRWIMKAPEASLVIGGNVSGDKVGQIISALQTVVQISGLVGFDLSNFGSSIKELTGNIGGLVGNTLNV